MLSEIINQGRETSTACSLYKKESDAQKSFIISQYIQSVQSTKTSGDRRWWGTTELPVVTEVHRKMKCMVLSQLHADI